MAGLQVLVTRRRSVARFLACAVLSMACVGATACDPEEPLVLTAFTSSRAGGEIILEWTGGPSGARWQYQYRPAQPHDVPWDGNWYDVPSERTRSTSFAVSGLSPGEPYAFRMRPRTRSGEPSNPATAWAAEVGPDGIAVAGKGPLERGGTFRLPSSRYWIFRVPEKGIFATGPSAGIGFPGDAILYYAGGATPFRDPDSATLFLDPNTGRDTGRTHPPGTPEPSVRELLDEIVHSVRYRPQEPVGPLFALIGADGDSIALEWEHHGTRVKCWHYRQRERNSYDEPWGYWGEWIPIAGCDPLGRNHRVSGLRGGMYYGFEVRPWTVADTPGGSYAAAVRLPVTDPGRFVRASMPESGGTFALSDDFVFDVPSGMHIRLLDLTYHPAAVPESVGLETNVRRLATAILDLGTGSTLVVYAPSGTYLDRHLTSEGEELGVDALFDEIVASIRPTP